MKPPWAGFVVLTILSGCTFEVVERDLGVNVPSPSGSYILGATESGRPSAQPSITLRLYDSNEKLLDTMATGIRTGGNWALGWAPNEDVIVVCDASTTMVYIVEKAGKLRTMECPPPKYGVIGQQLAEGETR